MQLLTQTSTWKAPHATASNQGAFLLLTKPTSLVLLHIMLNGFVTLALSFEYFV
jgi:hypothetical protein